MTRSWALVLNLMILQCLLTLCLGELIVNCSLDCIRLPAYAPKILIQYFLWRIHVVIEAFITKRGLRGIVGTPKTLVECIVYLQCRFLEVIVISHKVLAFSEVLIIFTCSCDCTLNTCVFFWFGVCGRIEPTLNSWFCHLSGNAMYCVILLLVKWNLYLYVYKVKYSN